MYNSLVERCFKDCVDSFRRKDLDATEEKVREGRGLVGGMLWGVVGRRQDVLLSLTLFLKPERRRCTGLGADGADERGLLGGVV